MDNILTLDLTYRKALPAAKISGTIDPVVWENLKANTYHVFLSGAEQYAWGLRGVFYPNAVSVESTEGSFDKLSREITPVSVPRELDLDFPKLKEGLQEL
ncbi:hypothetical protein BGZ65_008746 [Modicella reniformis]|uniref:Uncharacterized protein n=1 Tax=Modicella reniformis TaxID=1440133 RepID=A0A9P6JJL5_9FUNG|nr:hypothetical protein BGZ65_008746 [Modicella reniformis]